MKNALILLASFLVCAWGSEESLSFLTGFILLNWAFGLLLEKHKNALSLAIVCDISLLLLFKYLALLETIPFGLSFYTLSGVSYCVDVARGDAKAEKNLGKLALYLSLFTKLSMGPLVLYKDFEKQYYASQRTDITNIANGLFRFSVGLAKKLLMAGYLVDLTTYCWADAPQSTASAWLGLIGYALQLYYDFSGYSDMALGLSQIFGFKFKENFLYPYESSSLSEFWSRWHISLGNWFKNYLYIPLGGNRKGTGRTIFNLLIVWTATGIWHGNNLSLICWGLFLFIFVAIEKLITKKVKIPKVIGIIFTDFIVVLGWVFFNSTTVTDAIYYFGWLFGAAGAASSGISSMYYNNMLPFLMIAVIGCTSFPKKSAELIFDENSKITPFVKTIFMLALLAASVVLLVTLGYTPFIYQSF